MNQFDIRDARPDERDAIADLTKAAYEQYADVMTPTAWAGLRGAVAGGLEDEPTAQRIVAERDGVLIGSVLLCPPTRGAYGGAVEQIDWPEVRLLAVGETARGQGVAKALMAECERRARESGAPAIGLHTSESLVAAVRLYEQLGYERVPVLDFMPAGAELVMAYRKPLVQAQ